ncbi:MAG: DEAD/DEAH box helicase [Chlamydiota bacterium]|nr:DEAD/DEAH box helicase [Chlamydiota bacterium]
MHLKKSLEKYRSQAEQLIKQKLVRDIEFSGGTYQVLVYDKKDDKEGFWAFLHLDPKGELTDSFCACEESEIESGCAHITAAYIRIFNGRKRPIHARFRESLWNELCIIFIERVGDDSQVFDLEGSRYSFRNDDGNIIFSIEAKSDEIFQQIEDLLTHREEETEETSLKFSNLTEEELNLWRQGKPTPQLRYELSFWNDIAKKMMVQQDSRKPYNITFGYSDDKIPSSIKISFPDLEIFFEIRPDDLIRIIPFLKHVNSPLAVHTTQREAIQQITYDKDKGILNVQLKEEYRSESEEFEARDEKYVFGGWHYIPGEGFYAIDQYHILAQPNIQGKRLSDVLDSHAHIIKKLLIGDHFSLEPVTVSYQLYFDNNWDLHIEEYLFKPGDLTEGKSRAFGNWVYHDSQGFFPIEGRLFDDIETVILSEDVHSFISQYRMWLNAIEGFDTHLTSIEVKVGYTINSEGELIFQRHLTLDDEGLRSKDFGSWVYIEGQGFYSKVTSNINLSIDPDIPIRREEISRFIKKNRDELGLIANFFGKTSPLISAYLEVTIADGEGVLVIPRYKYLPGYEEKNPLILEDYCYVSGEGFCEIPLKNRLPEGYQQEKTIISDKKLKDFFENDLPAFPRHIHEIDYRVLEPSNLILEAEKIVKSEKRGKGVYGFQIFYVSDQGKVNVTDVWKAIDEKKKYLFSDSGRLDLEDQRYRWVKGLKKKQVDLRSNVVYLSTLEFLRVNAFDEILLRKSRRKDYLKSKKIFDALQETSVAEIPSLNLLKSTLRPYQDKGVKWLWFLYLNEISGLLCDDMGLGKTHQSMALMAAICAFHKEHNADTQMHFLVICPTSVIYHWKEKIEEFIPSLRVCTFHGLNRSLQDFREDYDVLLTSYGVWRNESALLRKVPFELAIFDEVQCAKNHTSGVHKSLLKVNAKMRLGLTGTPIENRLRELKSLFDVCLPGYMPKEKEYNDYFIKPIEKEENIERKVLLSKYIKPLILRRKKEDVLTDLPPKIEQISHCELLPEQLNLYNDVLKQSHRKLLNELQDEKNPVPYIHIFALLSNLKQICNHPAIYHKDPENFGAYESGKWNLFVELLSEARESNQKVVVFSQYLFMLDIIEKYLSDNSIGFTSIRGSTAKRGEKIKQFNTDPQCEVFVGSLQATGLGIDLTAGSVVIHYDRWWNAAREDQATDRVHRIGQTRGVQVFKLVTKNTFEEKIDELIMKKGALMEEVVGTDDHSFVKKFTREELVELLEYVEW